MFQNRGYFQFARNASFMFARAKQAGCLRELDLKRLRLISVSGAAMKVRLLDQDLKHLSWDFSVLVTFSL